MISVEQARAQILAAAPLLPAETIPLALAHGRVLAEDLAARLTQPAQAVSAMDGYAVRGADVGHAPVTLRRIGEAPAGRPFAGRVEAGECVRIFTGGYLPDGADTIVIQENVDAAGERVTVREATQAGRFVRPAGLDFSAGQVALRAGRLLSVRDIGLAAAMNRPWLSVRRRPRVAILATGDEIVLPGEPVAPGQFVSSNGPALGALVRALGGEAIDLGVARDSVADLRARVAGARGADLLLTCGGASVGEYDLVQKALEPEGLTVDFWRIAMRPGKPLMFGRLGESLVIGLPGNPVSSFVCGLLFVRPVLLAMQGLGGGGERDSAILGADLPANDSREDYLRARLTRDARGEIATAFAKQDSSMQSLLAQADCLIVRPPFAPPIQGGERVDIVRLAAGLSTL
jgi:molybdopterin molybdotransferase